MCKAELEKHDFREMSCADALYLVAKMLKKTNDEDSDKQYQLELSWISVGTNYKHQRVPQELLEQALEQAAQSIEQDEMEGEEDD